MNTQISVKGDNFLINGKPVYSEIEGANPASLGLLWNQRVIQGVFDDKIRGSNKDAIVLNAAGALVVGDKVDSFKQGVGLAQSIIESGAAKKKLDELREMSNAF